MYDDYDDDEGSSSMALASPIRGSALRAASKNNPRDRPCPQCGAKNVLTRIDRASLIRL